MKKQMINRKRRKEDVVEDRRKKRDREGKSRRLADDPLLCLFLHAESVRV